jgi:inosose dehydratase
VTTSEPPVRIAASPVGWGVDFADHPDNPPWESVLDDLRSSGVGALELGPVGYLPEDPAVLREALRIRALTSVGSFLFEELHDATQRDRVLAIAERVVAFVAAAGGGVVVIIDKPDAVRVATAGRSEAAPRLDARRWRQMIERIEEIAATARRAGLHPVTHPHVGGYIEFADEIERLVDDTDVDLCLDTGHLAYARIDPADAIRRYAGRLGHVHFKDVRSEVLTLVDADALTFWQAIEAGIFCPLGDGVVDFRAVHEALAAAGYSGYATIEQDRVPGTGAPLDDLRRSLAVIDAASRRPSRPPTR